MSGFAPHIMGMLGLNKKPWTPGKMGGTATSPRIGGLPMTGSMMPRIGGSQNSGPHTTQTAVNGVHTGPLAIGVGSKAGKFR